ncbi:MAG: hypothetical protein EXS25_06140 [Pedosphaera sp.]|nr:hypothetical protein [Pedosphaera sp.]
MTLLEFLWVGVRADTIPLNANSGWQIFGETQLFQWMPDIRIVQVTWDSSRSNSFLAYPLPHALTSADSFAFTFDLLLESHAVGLRPDRPSTFQITVGMVRIGTVTVPNYVRGSLSGPKDTVEWAWFGDSDPISASVSPVIIPSDGRLPWGYADSYINLEIGIHYLFVLAYSALDRTARITLQQNGTNGPALQPIVLPANFTDFQVDTFAISNYSDLGQHPLYGGSVLATGKISNLTLTLPSNPIESLVLRNGEIVFQGQPGWRFTLETSSDLKAWTTVSEINPLIAGELRLSDSREAVFAVQFYRVKARRP